MIILRQNIFSIRKKLIDHLSDKAYEYKDRDQNLTDRLSEEADRLGVEIYTTKGPTRYVETKGGKRRILMNKDTGNTANLAHELGHAYYKVGEGKDKIGGKIHKINYKLKKPYTKLAENLNKLDLESLSIKDQNELITKKSTKLRKSTGSAVSGLSGVLAGYKAAEEKEKGNKKKSRLISAASLGIPVLGHVPQMGTEISASKKGMEYLKKAGATKEQLKGSRKSMGYSLGTYGVDVGKNILLNAGGQVAGGGIYKLTHKKKKSKEESEKKD